MAKQVGKNFLRFYFDSRCKMADPHDFLHWLIIDLAFLFYGLYLLFCPGNGFTEFLEHLQHPTPEKSTRFFAIGLIVLAICIVRFLIALLTGVRWLMYVAIAGMIAFLIFLSYYKGGG